MKGAQLEKNFTILMKELRYRVLCIYMQKKEKNNRWFLVNSVIFIRIKCSYIN